MEKTIFCYAISADAGLAYDKVTKENTRAYTKVEFDFREKLSDDDYKKVHEVELIEKLSNQLGIQKEHFEPITISEYLDNNDDSVEQE